MPDVIVSYEELDTAKLIIQDIDPKTFMPFNNDTSFLDFLENKAMKRTVDNVKFEFETTPDFKQKYTVKSYNDSTLKITLSGLTAINHIVPYMFIMLTKSSTGQTLFERQITAVTKNGTDVDLTLESAFPLSAGAGTGVVTAGDEILVSSTGSESGGASEAATAKIGTIDYNYINFARLSIAGNIFTKKANQASDQYNTEKVSKYNIFKTLRQNKLLMGRASTSLLGTKGTQIYEPYGLLSGMIDSHWRSNISDAEPYIASGVQAIQFTSAITIDDLVAMAEKLSKGSSTKYLFCDRVISSHLLKLITNKVVPTRYDESLNVKLPVINLDGIEFIIIKLNFLDKIANTTAKTGYSFAVDEKSIRYVKHSAFPKVAVADVDLSDGYKKTTTKNEFITTDSIEVSNIDYCGLITYSLDLVGA
jgi:hypothetical protein